ncbi:dihydroorotase [Ancylobacter rudongensis]|uniref:Dihydroorotase n=1 Tax=Ancylobacter rudongensis TaxID=177413 RepID=A0A1G4URC0_9HYPH|nr:dihydroorotase [Ancylobacter rudongensis]SCW96181.1 dihydroorotase [Ancylobacter rudongensis]
MHESRPILLAKTRLIDPSRDLDTTGDILIADGIIKDIAPNLSAGLPPDTEIVDCRQVVAIPGLVDMRAFIGEPGAEHRETLASASQAAAAGGVTTIICQPDTDPVIDDPAIVDFILRRARDTAIVNVHPMAALTKGLEGREMTEIGLLGAAGAVAFTDGTRSIGSAQVLRRALTYGRDFGALIVHHTQDASLAGEGVMNEGELASRLGLAGLSKAAETIIFERDVRLAAITGGRYHAASLTCADSLEVLRRAKDAGIDVTASASINHLTLNERDVVGYRTFFKLTPPLRAEEDRLALVQAVAEGLIDIIVSDHNPQDVEVKRLPFSEAAFGAVGLETMLAAGLRLVTSGMLDLMTLVRAMSTRPAERLGLPGGTLRPGARADIALLALDEAWILDPLTLKSRCRNTPFDEARFEGRVVRTLVSGRTVYEYV